MTLHEVLVEGCPQRRRDLPQPRVVLVNCELRIANCDPDSEVNPIDSMTAIQFRSNLT
jgi:hypothetical protein